MTVPSTDPYAVLGLSPQATPEQIRRAYRTLVRQHHPDTRTPGDTASGATNNERLEQVIAAYATLADPVRRAEYDQRTIRSTPSRPPRTSPSVRSHHIADQPPIQAGPVYWHHGPLRGNTQRAG
jgi:curved DNA-binding protein CbpA